MFLIAISILLLLLFVSYYLLVARFIHGWDIIKPIYISNNAAATAQISCVVAFRNEQTILTKLIDGLKNQQHVNYEVILIDDHSSDNSRALVESLIADLPHFRLIKNKGKGKKTALAAGVAASRFDYIVFTDADCLHPPNWLSSMATTLKSYGADLLVGPVRLTEPRNFLQHFQTIDFLSLVTSGAGAIGACSPIMCNGANLAVSKKVWLQAQSSLKIEWASGDDIFLLQYCKAHKKKIAFVKSQDAIVQTYPEQELKAFLRQRARWASKSKAYTDRFTIYVAYLVLLTNIVLLSLPLALLVNLYLGLGLLGLSIIKIALDYLLIKRGALFFNIKLNAVRYLAIACIYPIYIVISVVWAALGSITWKNREV